MRHRIIKNHHPYTSSVSVSGALRKEGVKSEACQGMLILSFKKLDFTPCVPTHTSTFFSCNHSMQPLSICIPRRAKSAVPCVRNGGKQTSLKHKSVPLPATRPLVPAARGRSMQVRNDTRSGCQDLLQGTIMRQHVVHSGRLVGWIRQEAP